MATTTNYGWTTPDDTALVKDGAAAIRTLGSSVDTTTKALNPSTTLGDIEYRSSTANTNTRLGIGTTGQVLQVSGGVPSWATPASAASMTQLATGSLSSTVVNLSSIDQTYINLKLVIRLFFTSISGSVFIRVNANSGNNYMYSMNVSNSTSNKISAGTNAIYINDFANDGNDASSNQFAVIDFNDYVNATTFKSINYCANYANAGTSTPVVLGGFNTYKVAEAITEINIHASGGNLSGSYILYGVK
jgi:hypothetical protein